jgi:Tol biopolymer transport system component/tRNA A-37 threonylcarbamoyl transferase component Bud32
MPISSGSKLGPYEIVAPLGAGGMGEVYKARDTRLDRTVAIKILPQHLSANADLKQRFEREAKLISSLQHPHICTLHDVGSQDGVDFLVMEYLEGETLAQRLTKGPLPLDQVLKFGAQIADGLDKAHRQGIVHRDLKPGNIMLTKSGAKLMDFGLAKPAASGPGAATAPLVSAAVTLTSPQASPLTTAGAIVGTIQYMSPEQIEGKEADARSDIFAFGAVLYEMITGRRAFEGKSQLSVATAILDKDVEPLTASQHGVPAQLARVVATCLAKSPDDRWQCAADVHRALEWVEPNRPAAAAPVRMSVARIATIAAAAVVLVALAIAGGYWWANRDHGAIAVRADIPPPEKWLFDATGDRGGMPVLSPGGDKIAFVAHTTGQLQALWVRSLESGTSTRLEGTDGAQHPFWSPDGRSIGFFANGKLNRIAASGGPFTLIADALNPRGGAWGADDVIVFCGDFRNALMRVSANGGEVTFATTLDTSKHTTHRWPWFLPDGKHFIFLATNHGGGNSAVNGIYFASVGGKESHLVVTTDAGAQFASGYLLFHQQTALMAQPLDASSGRLTGTAVPLISNIRFDAGVWRAIVSVSQNGVLTYQAGSAATVGTRLAWFDRSGKVLGDLGGREYSIYDLRLSHDGKRVAFVIAGGVSTDLWTLNLERKSRTRITFSRGDARQPSWSPDDQSLVFTQDVLQGGGNLEIHSRAADGSGTERNLTPEPHAFRYPEWSPDGKYLVFNWGGGQMTASIWIVPKNGDFTKPVAIVQPPSPQANILNFRLSPDGRWLAYISDESGQNELYLTSFPEGKGKWQVSTDGASYPAWRGDGKEIFFKNLNDEFMVSSVTAKGAAVQVGAPQRLFRAGVPGFGTPFDVSADGKRLLINLAEEDVVSPLNIFTNWTSALKK